MNVDEELIRWSCRFDSSQIVAFYSSLVAVLRLDAAQRHQCLEAIAVLADARFGGDVERRFQTVIYTGRRP